MKHIIEKLTEIEDIASQMKASITAQKQKLFSEMEEECKNLDARLNKESEERLALWQKEEEEREREECRKLEEKAEACIQKREEYYAENHQRLARELFEEMIRM